MKSGFLPVFLVHIYSMSLALRMQAETTKSEAKPRHNMDALKPVAVILNELTVFGRHTSTDGLYIGFAVLQAQGHENA